jgi:hypothetical protein
VAGEIYDILVAYAGAPEFDARFSFVHLQSTRHMRAYRFSGRLGSGGKFTRNHRTLPEGGGGEL